MQNILYKFTKFSFFLILKDFMYYKSKRCIVLNSQNEKQNNTTLSKQFQNLIEKS